MNNIIAVAGPKGGVGKSVICANLSIALAELGKRVIAVDLDFGASNLHALLGFTNFTYSLNDFFQNRVKKLSDIVSDTNIENLKIIRGGDAPGMANIMYQKKAKLIRHLLSLNSDIIILDLAPGISYNVLDFSLIAKDLLLVTTPELTSLMNSYSFIKAAVFRKLSFFFKRSGSFELLELLEKAKDFENYPLKTMEDFFQEAQKLNPAVADSAKAIISNLRPLIIVNRIRAENDKRVGKVIQRMLRVYLGIESPLVMTVREDASVANALVKMKPVLLYAPDSSFSLDIKKIALEVSRVV